MYEPDQELLAAELSAYLDDELSPTERAEVEIRLRESAQARLMLDDLRCTSTLVAKLPRHSAPPAVASDLRTQLERNALLAGFDEASTAVVTERPGWFPRLSMAAMIGLVAIGGWWMMTGPGSTSTAPLREQLALSDTPHDTGPAATSKPSPGKSGLVNGGARANRLAIADIETKLAAGVPASELRRHAFDNEPIRLEVPVRYESQQATLLRKLSRLLASAKAVDLAGNSTKTGTRVGAFFYRGRPGVNYKKGTTRQLLVRVTRSQLDEVLREVGHIPNASKVTLKAGSLTLRGSKKATDALALVVSPNLGPDVGAAARTDQKQVRLNELLVALGVDPESFLRPVEEKQNVPASTLEKAKKRSQNEDRTSLVAKKSRQTLARRGKRKGSSNPKQANAPVVGDVALANTEMSVDAPPAAAQPKKPAETFVTFVIEIPVTKPTPSSAPTKHRSTKPTSNKTGAQ